MAPYINLMILKGHFFSLFRINTARIPIVISTDTPTQMKPSFISEEWKFLSWDDHPYITRKASYKNAFFLVIAFFS
jgi:hypothetical protein